MSMDTISQHYEDLDCAIDDIRGLLNEWLAELDRDPPDGSPSKVHEPSSSAPPPSSPRPPNVFGTNGHASTSRKNTPEKDTSDEDAVEEFAPPRPDDEDASAPPSTSDASPPRAAMDASSGAAGEASSQDAEPKGSQNDLSVIDTESRSPESDNHSSVVRYAQVVLHEWLANLVQHADFEERSPEIRVQIRAEKHTITCTVTDNSRGFDLQSQLAEQRNSAQALPERGMGLRIINACTQSCTYRPMDNGWHRFKFSIPADHEPWLSMLF